jgi:ABC-type glycerol-3-phosphate transport system substrate-binding protein
MRKLRWALLIVYALGALGALVAAFTYPPFRQVAYAPLRELVIPPPQPIVVNVRYSTEKAEWLASVIPAFEASRPTVQGRPIQLELSKSGSREMYLDVLDGAQPDVISPASSLQIAILEDLSEDKFGRPLVNVADPERCRPVVHTPLVLVVWTERADVLWGDEPNGQLWHRVHDAMVDPQGWESYGHPEWGYVKFGQTNPLKSNSGFMTILLMTYNYFDKTSGLTAQEILSSDEYQEWFVAFQRAIPQFGDSTGTYMREIVAYGPSAYDMVAVYEATAVEQLENAVGRYGELRVYYPPATVMSDHPFCVLDAAWVTPEKAEAARMFIDYLLSEEAQEVALMEHGFRPVEPSIPLDQTGSPFQRYEANGLRLELPPQVEIPPGNVLDTLLNFWNRNIQP